MGSHEVPEYGKWEAFFNMVENTPKYGPSAKINAQAVCIGFRRGGENATLGNDSKISVKDGLQGQKVRTGTHAIRTAKSALKMDCRDRR
jgi:hypothetical protein